MSRSRSLSLIALPALVALALLASPVAAFDPADEPNPDSGVPGGPKPGPAGAALIAPPKAVPWNDPSHIQYFRYQTYIADMNAREKASLPYETKDSWSKLSPQDQAKAIAAGEQTLRERFKTIMGQVWMDIEDEDLLKSVWGPDVLAAVRNVQVAKKIADKNALASAMAAVAKLQHKFGVLKVDPKHFFDGSLESADGAGTVAGPDAKNYLAPKAKSPDFLASLDSPETKAALKDQKSYAQFLHQHHVSEQAIPGMLAMYQVLSRTSPPEKAELEHILPTVVRFLKDGRSVVFNKDGPREALGMASPGPYDRPDHVEITPGVIDADPLIVGKTLAHEFEHIYDMYTGRYTTLDTELRGFKTAVLYLKTLKKTAPKKFDELSNSDDDTTRGIMHDAAGYTKAYDDITKDGGQAFAEAVGLDHNYSRWSEGVYRGNMPLRQALDPNFGAPFQLAGFENLRREAEQNVQGLKAQQATIEAKRVEEKRKGGTTRDLDKEYQKISKDLMDAHKESANLDEIVPLDEIRVTRMQSELDWLDKKAKAAGQPPPKYDLNMAVDKSYYIP